MITQRYNLNLIPNKDIVFVNVSQYDKLSRTIQIVLYNGSAPFEIPSGSTVTVRGTKEDNTGFEYPCTFVGNVVSFDVQEQMTIFAGKVPCEIRITSSGQIIGSCNFILNVEKTPLDSSVSISETYLPLLEEAEQNAIRAENAADEAEGVLASAVKSVNNVLPDANGNVDVESGQTYTAGTGIDIANNVISADTSVLATQNDLSDYVAKTGDTMTGPLTIDRNQTLFSKTSQDFSTTPSSSAYSNGLRLKDSNDVIYGIVDICNLSDGNKGLMLSGKRIVNGIDKDNRVFLTIDDTGNAVVRVVGTNVQNAWKTAIGAVYKAGDTLSNNASSNGYMIVPGALSASNYIRFTIPVSKEIIATGITFNSLYLSVRGVSGFNIGSSNGTINVVDTSYSLDSKIGIGGINILMSIPAVSGQTINTPVSVMLASFNGIFS